MKTLSNTVNFSRTNLELLYSIVLLLLIPAMMVANTVYISTNLRRDIGKILNHQAVATNNALMESIKIHNGDPIVLQSILIELETKDDLIDYIGIYKPGVGNYSVIAATNPQLVGQTVVDNRFSAVMANLSEQRSVAGIITREGTRFTSVVSPAVTTDGTVLMLQTDISLASADAALGNTYFRSFVILFVTVFVIALLLTNHFRFVGYAQLTKKLQEADRLKTDFLSVATHELKAPMSAVKGNIANVLDGTFGEVNDQIKTSLATAVKETDRLTSLVQDLLNVSRIEQGRISFDIKPIDPVPIVQSVVDTYVEKASEKGLFIDYEPLAGGEVMLADSGRYQEIMTNLVDNAVKYSLQGRIIIRHEITKDRVITKIRDTGIGMSAQERERLFQRFYRVRNQKTKNIGGTGLGLWIVRQYIEKMGGLIVVDALEGVGSEFIVELPRG